jgi:hypothetical protein
MLAAWLLTGCGSAAVSAPAEAPASESYNAELESVSPVAGEQAVDLSMTQVASSSTRRPRSIAGRAGTAFKEAPPPRAATTDASQSGAKTAADTPNSTTDTARTEAPAANGRAPLLIYTATIAMAVFGLDAALASVEELARAHDGYLVRRSDTSITVRVPAAHFQEALTGVGKLGDELHRDVSARDVTEEYADLEIRLRNAEVVRQRLETLLAKAGGVEDALTVERELARVTGSIEELKGKLKLMSELAAFSTITVNFQARSVEHVSSEHPLPFDWLKELGLSNLLAL